MPASGIEILNAVAMALPDLKPSIERVLAGYRGNTLSVAKALDPVIQSQDSILSSPAGLMPAPLARAPIFGPPFIPLSGTPTNVQPTTSGKRPARRAWGSNRLRPTLMTVTRALLPEPA